MAQILRVSIRGNMPGGEVWTINPCWEINGSTGAPVTPATAATLATAIAAVAVDVNLKLAMAAGTNVTGCRVEARSLSGTLESQAEAVKGTPDAGTGTAVHPYGTAIVLSLRTPGAGGSARGRLYWPATGQGLNPADYRLSTSNATNLLGGFKTYLSALEAAIKVTLPEANLTVWSRKTTNFFNVTQLQLGNVLDSQRRRRDTLVEAYNAVSFP